MSTLKVDTILKRTGTGTITVGQSGDTISIPTTLNATTLQQNGSTIPTSFGKVLQTVAQNFSSYNTLNTNGRSDLFTQAITPIVASSKILVSFSLAMGNNVTGVSAINLQRDVNSGGYSELGQASGAGTHNGAAGGAYDTDANVLRQISYVYLDSPSYSVGNAITYKLQYYQNSTSNSFINRTDSNAIRGTSNIVLMEIGA